MFNFNVRQFWQTSRVQYSTKQEANIRKRLGSTYLYHQFSTYDASSKTTLRLVLRQQPLKLNAGASWIIFWRTFKCWPLHGLLTPDVVSSWAKRWPYFSHSSLNYGCGKQWRRIRSLHTDLTPLKNFIDYQCQMLIVCTEIVRIQAIANGDQ